jgi:hypothetical protein
MNEAFGGPSESFALSRARRDPPGASFGCVANYLAATGPAK